MCLGPQSVPRSFPITFKTILKNFLKIDSGAHGKPILPSELLKRFENAWNKHFWSDFFSKNFLNDELLELPLLTRATQGDNKKICRVDFRLMAYFLKKSILSVHSGEKPAKSVKMKLKIALKMKKKLKNFDFFQFFSKSILERAMVSKRCMDVFATSKCPQELSNHI